MILSRLAHSLLFCLATAPVSARIWTDAKDPTKQFEGELVAISETKAGIKLGNGKIISVLRKVLSESDRYFLDTPAAKKVVEEYDRMVAEAKLADEEKKKAEEALAKAKEKEAEKEKEGEKGKAAPVEKAQEKTAEKPAEKAPEKTGDKPAEKAAEKADEEKPAEPAAPPAEAKPKVEKKI